MKYDRMHINLEFFQLKKYYCNQIKKLSLKIKLKTLVLKKLC